MDVSKRVILKSILFGALSSLFFQVIKFMESVLYYHRDVTTALAEIRFFPDSVVFLMVFSIMGYFMFKNQVVSEE